MVRFVDDIEIISESEQDLNKILETMREKMERDLNIKNNATKMNILVCRKKNNIRTRTKLKGHKIVINNMQMNSDILEAL